MMSLGEEMNGNNYVLLNCELPSQLAYRSRKHLPINWSFQRSVSKFQLRHIMYGCAGALKPSPLTLFSPSRRGNGMCGVGVVAVASQPYLSCIEKSKFLFRFLIPNVHAWNTSSV